MVEYMKQYKDEDKIELSEEGQKASAELKNKISGILDIPEMARLILSSHWDKLSRKEQEKYAGLMVKLVETIAYPQAEEYFNSGLTVKYCDEKVMKDNRAVVKSVIIYEKEDFEISSDFYLHKENSRWRIYNIITEGESLLLIYQNQHMRIIKEKGFPHLIELMEKKLEQMAGNEP
jgi:ABC-type transporter MlaC component